MYRPPSLSSCTYEWSLTTYPFGPPPHSAYILNGSPLIFFTFLGFSSYIKCYCILHYINFHYMPSSTHVPRNHRSPRGFPSCFSNCVTKRQHKTQLFRVVLPLPYFVIIFWNQQMTFWILLNYQGLSNSPLFWIWWLHADMMKKRGWCSTKFNGDWK